MEEDRLIELVLGFFGKQLSSAEAEELRLWAAAAPENRKRLAGMQEIWMAVCAESAASEFDTDRAYERFRQKVGHRAGRRRGRSVPGVWRLAGVFAVLALAVVFSYRRAETKAERRIRASFAEIVVEAPPSSQSRILLPDSSEVWMNAGSRLVYSQGFGLTDRTVKMSGECYFSVRKDAARPFVVLTPNLRVRVLGTKFNFRSYPDDDEATVSLEEGSVSLKNLLVEEGERILAPNQKAVLNNRTGLMRIDGTLSDNHSAWLKGRLFFNDELLTDIVKELKRNYDVEIEIASVSLRQQRFYGGFDRKDLNIDEILDRFAATGNIRYRKEGAKIVLF